MDQILFKAILAMDSYNRGYNSGLDLSIRDLSGNVLHASDAINIAKIGTATVYDTQGDAQAQNISFYGIAYELSDGEIVISYRGTDDPLGNMLIDGDIWNGWTVGGGATAASSRQAEMAFAFYNAVATAQNNNTPIDPRNADISLTGHSLGAGLAGLVGAVYLQEAALFDNMPFELSAFNTYETSTLGSQNYNPDLREMIYGAYVPWNPVITNLSSSNLKSYSIAGEVLQIGRGITQVTPETLLTLDGETTDGVDLSSNPISESIMRHDMATFIIRYYAEVADDGNPIATNWQSAAQYFWPVLYDTNFAGAIGMANVAGQLAAEGKYDQILRQIIAYSAIDDGGADNDNDGYADGFVFGDTAIKVFYNNANEFGDLLSREDLVDSIDAYITEITQVYVEFSAQLALNHTLSSSYWGDQVLNVGDALSVSYINLELDFSEELWQLDLRVVPSMYARESLMMDLYFDSGAESFLRASSLNLWGDDTANVIGKVTFAIVNDAETVLSSLNDVTKANLFIGAEGKDIVTTSSNGDMVLAGSGNDYIKSSDGSDIFLGGDNYDTVDYSTDPAGITVFWNADGTVIVEDGYGKTDILQSIERIIGKSGAQNTLQLSGSGNLIEVSPGRYQFNGYELDLRNITTIKGDENTQHFYLITPPVGLDGGGSGADVDILSFTNSENNFYNQLNGLYYANKGTNAVLVSDIENENILANQFVLDASGDISYELGQYNDFSTASLSITFNFDSTFSVSGGSIKTYSADIHASIEIGGVERYFEEHTFYETALGTQQYQQEYAVGQLLTKIHENYGMTEFNLRGSDNGDIFNISIAGTILGNPTLITGYGNDTVNLMKYFEDIVYTGGNDTITGADHLQSITMWAAIRPEDVTVSMGGSLITVAGHGTISLVGRSASNPIEIIYEGSKDAAEIEGSWATDSWTGYNDRDEVFYAYGGNDTLNGNGGQDKLYGGDGNDTIAVIGGTAGLWGGSGDDVYTMSQNALVTLTDQVGDNEIYLSDINSSDITILNYEGSLIFIKNSAVADWVYYNDAYVLAYTPLSSILTITEGSIFSSIRFMNDEVLSYDDVLGLSVTELPIMPIFTTEDDDYLAVFLTDSIWVDLKSGNDTFILNSSHSSTIYGGDGADAIIGGAGNDYIYGGNGDDYGIEGGAGDDVLVGGSGNDTLSYSSAIAAVTVTLATTLAQATGGAGSDTISGFENLNGSQYSDALQGDLLANIIHGEAGDDSIYGGSGDDFLYGDDGDDYIQGDEGNDHIYGGDGNDILIGMQGDDVINGGNGNDAIYDYSGNDTYDGGSGENTITFYYMTAVNADMATGVATHGSETDFFVNFQQLWGSSQGDILYGDDNSNVIGGEGGNDTLYGRDGNDTVTGGEGNDSVYGDAGSDLLYGGNGSDSLYGGADADYLIGNSGADTLTGGGGGDYFAFFAADGSAVDTITDFNISDGDVIDLRDLLIGYDPLTSAITDFVTFTSGGGNSTMSIDRDGAAGLYSSQAVALITGVTGLNAASLLSSENLTHDYA